MRHDRDREIRAPPQLVRRQLRHGPMQRFQEPLHYAAEMFPDDRTVLPSAKIRPINFTNIL